MQKSLNVGKNDWTDFGWTLNRAVLRTAFPEKSLMWKLNAAKIRVKNIAVFHTNYLQRPCVHLICCLNCTFDLRWGLDLFSALTYFLWRTLWQITDLHNLYLFQLREGWQVPSRGPPCNGINEMQAEPATTSPTSTIRAGCVRRGLGTPVSRRGACLLPRMTNDSIMQLNTEALSANKISVIEQLAGKNKALIIVLQETHCTTANKLVSSKPRLAQLSHWSWRLGNTVYPLQHTKFAIGLNSHNAVHAGHATQ